MYLTSSFSSIFKHVQHILSGFLASFLYQLEVFIILLQRVSYLFDAFDQLFVPSAFALFDAYLASFTFL